MVRKSLDLMGTRSTQSSTRDYSILNSNMKVVLD